MSYKVLISFSLLTSIFNKVYPPPADESVTIKGYVEMKDLNEDIPFHLSLVDGHPVAYLDILIYVDGQLALKDKEVSSVIHKRPYYIKGFDTYNQSKKIKVVVNYIDKGLPDSVAEFTYYTPSYQSHVIRINESIVSDKNQVRVDFQMKEDNASIKYTYEKITLNGTRYINTNENRFFPFDKFNIYSTTSLIDIDYAELKIYEKFKNTDLLYKNGYTTTDISVLKTLDNKFSLIKENKFYINNVNGGIYEKKDENCTNDAYPFFFPLSFDDNKQVKFQIIYYDIGINHCDYIFEGYIFTNIESNDSFGSVLSYKYEEITEELEVTYE